jgi:hypothetical protein
MRISEATARDELILAQGLGLAIGVLENLPEDERPFSNIAEMRDILALLSSSILDVAQQNVDYWLARLSLGR